MTEEVKPLELIKETDEGRFIDVDALLEKKSLKIKLDGETYKITDIPVSASADMQSKTGLVDNLEFLRMILIPCGIPEEALTGDKLGTRKVIILAMALADFLAGEDILANLPISQGVKDSYKTGQALSQISAQAIPPTK